MTTLEEQATSRRNVDTITVAKRKYASDTNGMQTNISAEQQNDILDVLKSRNIADYLDHEIATSEPSTKKARISSAASARTTLATKLARAQYTTLQEISQDVERVSDGIATSIREKHRQDKDHSRPTIDELKQLQKASVMKQAIEELIKQEAELEQPNGHDGVAIKSEDSAQSNIGTVLTLFGNAPTPKQLFSSLQNDTNTSGQLRPSLLVEEMSLPNGLSATKIEPLTARSDNTTTFAEAFAPPLTAPALVTPKAQKRPSTRDNTIAWEFKDTSRGSKRGGYTTQPLTVAEWLSYGGDALTPREKRKQRDRALSSSGSDAPVSMTGAELAADLERQEEALFRQAYSSYAPAYDNSRSIIDASLKSLVWWHKIGNKKFESRFSLDPALRDYDAGVRKPDTSTANDDGLLTKAIEEYLEGDEVDDLPLDDTPRDMTTVDEVLQKITDLLETLASYQRLRHAAVAPPTITKIPISPAPVLSGSSGKVDVPSEDEKTAYKDLQREIAYLVLKLPPYAVTKLNGQQLEELGVSKIITYEDSNYRGQMEEDQAARNLKYTAAAAAAGIASLTRSTTGLSNPHYSSTSRTPAIGQSANTRYGSTSYSGRTPGTVPVAQRAIAGQASYGTPTMPPRSQQSTQYTRPATQQYGLSNGQTYQQRPSNYGYNTSYGQARTGYGGQSAVPQYQSRSQMAAANAIAYQTSAAYSQSISPGKAAISGHATPLNHASPAQTSFNGLQNARASLMTRGVGGTPQLTPGAVNGH